MGTYEGAATAVQNEEYAAQVALKRLTTAAKKLTSLDIEALALQAELWATIVGGRK